MILKIKNQLRVAFCIAILLNASSCIVGGIVSNTDMEEQTNSTATGPRPIGDGMAVAPPNGMTQTVSIVSFDNVLRNMNRVTGTAPSPGTTANFNQNRTTYPQSGNPSEINAAMWLSITTLAANVCQDLYNQEKSITDLNNRIFFKDFSLRSGVSNNFSRIIDGKSAEVRMIEKMGRSFWGREPSSTESTMIGGMMLVNDAGATITARSALDEAQARTAVISSCTVMLASLEAIQN